MSKKLFIETLGCAMNVRDSEHMIAELITRKDYTLTDQIEVADLILINTCSVREKPVSKLFSEIGIFVKRKKSSARIGVCGCTASHLGNEILRRAPAVDFVLGSRNVSKIAEIIERPQAVEVDLAHDESTYAFESYRANPWRAMVNVTIGCDKSCTYCIVPHTRGEEISIPAEHVLREIEKAVDAGAREVILLGQNVNGYGRRFGVGIDPKNQPHDFTALLRQVSRVEGLKRIRFQSPHPLHMDDAFINEFASNPKICKQIHVPLQSGSTRLLRTMKRGYTQEQFVERCDRIRSQVPDVTISTDVIVGFPGESDADFAETMTVLKHVRFEQMFSFKYSPRPHTEAAHYDHPIDPAVAQERLTRLQAYHGVILDEIKTLQEGRTYSVYFDELITGGRVSGRTDNGWRVSVLGGEALLGMFRDVRITRAMRTALEGMIV